MAVGLLTLLTVAIGGITAATTTWGWAEAEKHRSTQAQAGFKPTDPLGSILGSGSGIMSGIMPLILIFMLMKGGLGGKGGDGDGDTTNIVVVDDEED